MNCNIMLYAHESHVHVLLRYFLKSCSWYSALSSTSTAKTVAPAATSKVATLERIVVLDSNLTLSNRNALNVFIMLIKTSNQSLIALF